MYLCCRKQIENKKKYELHTLIIIIDLYTYINIIDVYIYNICVCVFIYNIYICMYVCIQYIGTKPTKSNCQGKGKYNISEPL